MAEIKLYLDEDISQTVAVVLRSRGFDAVSVHEAGMRGKTDEEQMAYAINDGRVLLTFNAKHFAPLAKQLYKNGQSHFGIVISKQVNLSEMIRLIVRMLKAGKADDLKDSFMWLQSFK